MSPYKISAKISSHQELTLRDLPFEAGAVVEVTVWPISSEPRVPKKYPLRGVPVRYEEPFEPVALDDWSALQ